MKQKIRSDQYVLLLIAFLAGNVLLLSLLDNALKQDAWTAIPAGWLLSMPFILCYVHLCKRFPGRNLMEINDTVFGIVLGRIVSVLYVLYFVILLSFNLRDLGDFYIGLVLPDTPMISYLIVVALVSAYAVNKGMVAISRISIFIVINAVFVIVSTAIMLIGNMDMSNFLPMFEASPINLLRGYHIMTALPFCEVFVFMMVMPGVDKPQRLTRLTLMGVGGGAALLLAVSMRNTAVLGNASSILVGNSFQSVRIISIGEILTRIEMLVAIAITLCLFIKITTCHFALVKGVTHVLGLHSGKPLILPLALICVVLSYIAFDSSVAHAAYASKYHMFYPLLPEFILPPLTVLVAVLRRLGGTQKATT